jgi:hypothetical protein
MSRAPRTENRFRSREAARAVRAVRLAGEIPTGVEIDPATGRITVSIARPDQDPTPGAEAWDKATEDLRRKKQGRIKDG